MSKKYKISFKYLENCKKSIKISETNQRHKRSKFLEFNKVKSMKDFLYKISKITNHKKPREDLNTISITSKIKTMKMERIKSH